MGVMLRIFILFTLLTCLGAPVHAGETPDPYARFATCAGRLSALMEHQWLIGAAGADLTRAQRQGMIDLLETAPAPNPKQHLARRIEAKHLLARMLLHAEFATSARDRRMARSGADRAIAECRALTLG